MLTRAAREEDQSGTVSFETLDVCGEGFGRKIGTARVDGDTDCRSQFAWDASLLDQRQCIRSAQQSTV